MSARSGSSPGSSLASLWFGILATPFAWAAQGLFSYMLASVLCASQPEGLTGGRVHALSAPFFAVMAATLALGLSGAWVAHANWRKLRGQRHRGDTDHVSNVHERRRFLALCGWINAVVFLAAFAFSIANILAAPLCGT